MATLKQIASWERQRHLGDGAYRDRLPAEFLSDADLRPVFSFPKKPLFASSFPQDDTHQEQRKTRNRPLSAAPRAGKIFQRFL